MMSWLPPVLHDPYMPLIFFTTLCMVSGSVSSGKLAESILVIVVADWSRPTSVVFDDALLNGCKSCIAVLQLSSWCSNASTGHVLSKRQACLYRAA